MSDLVGLKPGTVLADEYRIERTLGAGGFGITYLAEEIALARQVTIKEYFPVDFAARDQSEDVVPRSRECEGDYSWGLDRFLAEAQTLARFNHPNIVRVYRFFPARNTGYIVLHYEEGTSFKGWLKGLGRAPRQPELDKVLDPLLGALEAVHAADYLHRDIAPDNIMIRRDGQPVLIDFGSARGDIAKHSKTISALVKPGYSPYEQYATTSRQQGPWTDIYSLGATLYEAVTGRRPTDAPSRMVADDFVPPADAALSSYRPRFLAAIAKALRLEINERPRSVAEWRSELFAPVPQRREPSPVQSAGPAAVEPEPASAGAVAQSDGRRAKRPVEARQQSDRASAPARSLHSPGPASLAAAFLDGWRRGSDADRSEASLGAQRSDPRPEPPPHASARSPGRLKAKAETKASAGPPQPPDSGPMPSRWGKSRALKVDEVPGARRASPRALRRQVNGVWRALAVKLVIAVCVAAAVVALQDRIPVVRLEGAGLLTSQGNAEIPLTELKGHRGSITGLVFADTTRVVTTSADATLRVWQVVSGSLLRTFELDNGPATALAVWQKRAATGHTDGTIAIWDIETGTKLATLKRNDVVVSAVLFAGGPDRIVASGMDHTLALWSIGQPSAPLRVLEGHEASSNAVAFAERGPFVAVGGTDATIKLWNLEKNEVVRTYRGHEDLIAAVAFEPHGRTLASASRDGQIRLWSTYSNRLKRRLTAHQGSVFGLVFAPDGDLMVSGGTDGTVRYWDPIRGKLLRTSKSGVGAVAALGISPDGRRIAVAGSDGTIRIMPVSVPREGS